MQKKKIKWIIILVTFSYIIIIIIRRADFESYGNDFTSSSFMVKDTKCVYWYINKEIIHVQFYLTQMIKNMLLTWCNAKIRLLALSAYITLYQQNKDYHVTKGKNWYTHTPNCVTLPVSNSLYPNLYIADFSIIIRKFILKGVLPRIFG